MVFYFFNLFHPPNRSGASHAFHAFPAHNVAVAPCALRRCSFFGLHHWAPWLSWTHIENRASIISHISIPSLGCFNSTIPHFSFFYMNFKIFQVSWGMTWYDMAWHPGDSSHFYWAWPCRSVRFCARLGFGDDIDTAEEKRSRRLGKKRAAGQHWAAIFVCFSMGKWWF